MAREKKIESAPKESSWRRRARRLLFWGIVLQLVAIAAFIVVLLIGERSRVTLIALYLPRQPVFVVALLGALLAPLTKRRMLLWIQIVATLVVFVPVMGLSVSMSRSAREPIRFATYNVFWGKLGRPELLEELGAMPVDIIVMQAAYASMGEALHQRFPDRTVRQDGELVIMTRFPVQKVDVPPPLPDEAAAMFVKYVIETPAGRLRVVNVHPFSPRHALFWDEETGANIRHREEQIAAAVSAGRSDIPPFVIVGDTNLPHLSSIGRRHLGPLKDAFDEVGFGFGFTFPANRPWMRIDRAAASEGIRFTDARVGPWGKSDHRPLFFDIELLGEH